MPANDRRQYWQAIDALEKPIRDEFERFVTATVAGATVISIEQHLRERDTTALLREMDVPPGALAGMHEAIRTAYLQGGQFEAPQARIMFDIRNPRAESWLRENSSQLVTRINEAQRAAIRVTLESGMEIGRGPRQTALDIVGRIGPTGRRTGGIVGLTEPQARYVANARADLLSGDPERMVRYFTRARRDRRFDHIVRRAINAGRPVSVADVDRITGRYADRLLFTRGETIARTEATAAFNAAREEAMNQAVEQGKVHQDLITRAWDSAGDARVRPNHAAMNGQTRPAGQPFQSPSGALLMHPGDSSMGAGAADVANCRCFERIRYSFIGAAASKRL